MRNMVVVLDANDVPQRFVGPDGVDTRVAGFENGVLALKFSKTLTSERGTPTLVDRHAPIVSHAIALNRNDENAVADAQRQAALVERDQKVYDAVDDVLRSNGVTFADPQVIRDVIDVVVRSGAGAPTAG